MSDFVILHGVADLLNNKTFPFTEYKVEFGNEDRNGFDIRAESNGETLVGEAFNVAPSFFQGKKRTALKKLRKNAVNENYRKIMFNSDAPPKNYTWFTEPGVQQIAVHIPAAVPASGA